MARRLRRPGPRTGASPGPRCSSPSAPTTSAAPPRVSTRPTPWTGPPMKAALASTSACHPGRHRGGRHHVGVGRAAQQGIDEVVAALAVGRGPPAPGAGAGGHRTVGQLHRGQVERGQRVVDADAPVPGALRRLAGDPQVPAQVDQHAGRSCGRWPRWPPGRRRSPCRCRPGRSPPRPGAGRCRPGGRARCRRSPAPARTGGPGPTGRWAAGTVQDRPRPVADQLVLLGRGHRLARRCGRSRPARGRPGWSGRTGRRWPPIPPRRGPAAPACRATPAPRRRAARFRRLISLVSTNRLQRASRSRTRSRRRSAEPVRLAHHQDPGAGAHGLEADVSWHRICPWLACWADRSS